MWFDIKVLRFPGCLSGLWAQRDQSLKFKMSCKIWNMSLENTGLVFVPRLSFCKCFSVLRMELMSCLEGL